MGGGWMSSQQPEQSQPWVTLWPQSKTLRTSRHVPRPHGLEQLDGRAGSESRRDGAISRASFSLSSYWYAAAARGSFWLKAEAGHRATTNSAQRSSMCKQTCGSAAAERAETGVGNAVAHSQAAAQRSLATAS